MPQTARPGEEQAIHGAVTIMKKANISIRDLYPQLSEEELAEAEQNLMNYLKVIVQIGERLARAQSRSKDQPLS